MGEKNRSKRDLAEAGRLGLFGKLEQQPNTLSSIHKLNERKRSKFFRRRQLLRLKRLRSLQEQRTGEDELEAELEELEGVALDEQLLQTATTAPAPPVQVPAVRLPTQPVLHKNTSEADEFAASQAEMAM
ncbi:hypothetical protein OPV22_018179 [Ensete ventricosum]|uniref:Uncharacterized protein n=1 Tax=Ensete ventricosum TaxID=4639 RepID=A0AAV8QQ10_ENSVE|nr:hypothetical protein OPV22_018179 [Ensete ventricosum]